MSNRSGPTCDAGIFYIERKIITKSKNGGTTQRAYVHEQQKSFVEELYVGCGVLFNKGSLKETNYLYCQLAMLGIGGSHAGEIQRNWWNHCTTS